MVPYQAQMAKEIQQPSLNGDFEDSASKTFSKSCSEESIPDEDRVTIENPVLVTFWECDHIHPSPEDHDLRAYDIIGLIADGNGGSASCVIDMNVYVRRDKTTGFTLDQV